MPEGQTPDSARDPEVLPLSPLRGSETPREGRCNSHLKSWPDRFCTSPPVRGRNRCRMHGGRSLSGIASPSWKHGMYSTALAGLGPLADAYKTARQNPALVQLTEQIALIDARTEQLFGRLQTGESQHAWQQAQDALGDLREAQRSKDGAAMVTALTAISAAVEHGQSDAAIWAEITTNIYLRKKLVDSESRRRKDAHEMVTKDQVLAMMGGLAQAVLQHVPDVRQRQAVVDHMRLMIAGSAR